MDLASKIKGKTVLVTGASAGLGEHFARLAARSGAAVIVAARRKEKLEALAAELASLGAARTLAVDLDVTDETSVADAFATIEKAGPLDVVVNNAGVTRVGAATELTAADFDAVVDTNLRGVWLASTEAARRWQKAKRGGVIVNIASILNERVAGQVAPYAASKAGVVQLTKALALEWARYGIRVNALAPGYIQTDLNAGFFDSEPGQAMLKRIAMRRLGRPEDLDGALLLLATDASAWMTGSVITVDGGHLLSSL